MLFEMVGDISAGSPNFARSKSKTSAEVLSASRVTTRSRGGIRGGPLRSPGSSGSTVTVSAPSPSAFSADTAAESEARSRTAPCGGCPRAGSAWAVGSSRGLTFASNVCLRVNESVFRALIESSGKPGIEARAESTPTAGEYAQEKPGDSLCRTRLKDPKPG